MRVVPFGNNLNKKKLVMNKSTKQPRNVKPIVVDMKYILTKNKLFCVIRDE